MFMDEAYFLMPFRMFAVIVGDFVVVSGLRILTSAQRI
jgi:hypothetical protein